MLEEQYPEALIKIRELSEECYDLVKVLKATLAALAAKENK